MIERREKHHTRRPPTASAQLRRLDRPLHGVRVSCPRRCLCLRRCRGLRPGVFPRA